MTGFLMFLLFVAPTIQYRVEAGPFSFAVMEPIVLIVSFVLLANELGHRKALVIGLNVYVVLAAAMVAWAALVRPWAADSRHGLSDVRDWAIPVVAFVVVSSTVRRGWARWTNVFLLGVFLNAALGITQHFADSFRPFVTSGAAHKTSFALVEGGESLATASFAVGLFEHPNSYAMYIFLGLMVALGQIVERSTVRRVLGGMTIALALYFSYAKASLIVMAIAVAVFVLGRRIRSPRVWMFVISAVGTLAALALLFLARYVPPALLNTFNWRVGLWKIGIDMLSQQPNVLVFGNGLEAFGRVAYYGQPHNLYIYLLLDYGIIGLLLVALLIINLWRHGQRLRRVGLLEKSALLSAMWVAVVGYFAIGLVESTLFGVESRMVFLNALALFVGYAREMDSRRNASAKSRRIAPCDDLQAIGLASRR